MVAYNTSVGLGDTHDFAPDFSFLGFSFDWRARVSENFWPGISLGWQVLYGKDVKTLSYRNTTFTGTIATSLNVFPMLATGNYYFLTDPRGVRPYAGLGVGAYAAEHRLDVGVWTITDTSWHFGLAPEIGAVLPTGKARIVVSIQVQLCLCLGPLGPAHVSQLQRRGRAMNAAASVLVSRNGRRCRRHADHSGGSANASYRRRQPPRRRRPHRPRLRPRRQRPRLRPPPRQAPRLPRRRAAARGRLPHPPLP